VILKTSLLTRRMHVLRAWSDLLVQPQQWKRDMRFGTWSARSLYRSGSLTAVTRELAMYKSYLGAVQVGQRGHCKSREFYFILWESKRR
jgi:hypothetical protein